MARNTGAVCRLCRREGMKLFLKGERCYMAKCPVEQGRPAPGMHGQRRRGKESDYGRQLREKQRLRRAYGLSETQFRLFFQRAARKGGLTGEILLQMLEMRLDNLVYRLGFSASRPGARQFVLHGHATVDGQRATIPSMICRTGAVLGVEDKSGIREMIAPSMDAAEARGISPWLSLDKQNAKGEILHCPTRDEIAPIVNEQLIVELYSK